MQYFKILALWAVGGHSETLIIDSDDTLSSVLVSSILLTIPQSLLSSDLIFHILLFTHFFFRSLFFMSLFFIILLSLDERSPDHFLIFSS